jgi:salicylate hydroxylase
MAGTLIDERVLIAGAGIGGLSAAIALAHHGISSHVLERSKAFSTDGAGIQLGPNATRILKKWGILDALNPLAVRPECIEIHDGRTGTLLNTVPLGKTSMKRYGAPYLVVHRADLHKTLLEKSRDLDRVTLKRHFEVERVVEKQNPVTVQSSDGATEQGRLVIGADGLWSCLRGEVSPSSQTHFSGKTAWRTLLDISTLPPRFREKIVGLWMAPSAHLVHYPVRAGKALNLVAVIQDASAEQGWNAPGDPEQIKAAFRDWPEDIRSLISGVETWRKWSLSTMPQLSRWSRDDIVLLGDAAHPVLPFLAQGGVLAIEDADALALALRNRRASQAEAFKEYESVRMIRAAAVQAASRRMGHIYHLSGIAAYIRNLVLSRRDPEVLLKSYDWLYGFGKTD